MATCPSCRRENPPGFRFCGTCGAAIVANDAGEVRKTVTVLFCDMVGSTALGERTDPEVLRELMRRYHATCREILERHGGAVEKFVGDAAMAVFGIPRVHEDDPLRAVRAAVELRDAVAERGIRTRIGVNTGEVVTGRGETLVTGDAVNVAARLEQTAHAGEILIGAATAELVGDAVRTDPAEPLALKGKREPVMAYRVRELVADASPFARAIGTPFVGRTAELAQLEAALDVAQRGTPQLVTVAGPPGIGKSRLVRELLARTNARVLVGRCLSYGAGITYWPLAEIARQIGDVRAAVEHDRDPDLVFARVGAAVGRDGAAATPEDIAWGFRRLFESLARRVPLVVVLDDIHWAEPTLLDLIEYVASFARDVPLTILCTARPELFERRPGWATPRGNALVLTLEPLAGSDTSHLVEELGQLSTEQRTRVVEVAEGNPLFVEQLVAMHRDHGDDALAIPLTLQALLAARIDGLAPHERAVLERGAVEGRVFHRGSVAQLLPEPERAGVGAQLLTLVRKALVRPDQTILPGDDGYRFGHVLIRDAAYEAIPKRQRAELHERFGEWLGRRLGDAAPPEIIGYHLEQAYRYHDELGAIDASLGMRAAKELRRAADNSRHRGDAPATAGFFARAAALLPSEHSLRPELLMEQADALLLRGDFAGAEPVLAETLAAARRAGNEHIEWRARLALVDVRYLREPEGSAPVVLAEGRAAIAAAERRGDHLVAALGWAAVGRLAMNQGRIAERRDALERATRHARAAGDRRLEAEIRMSWGPAILFGDTPVADGLRLIEEMLEVVRDVPTAHGFVAHVSGHLRARTGDHTSAKELIGIWRMRMRELGRDIPYATSAPCVWDVASLAGELALGEAALREGYAILESRGEKGFLSTVAAHLGEACLLQGRLDEAERYVRRSAELGASDDVLNEALWRRVQAQILTARGDREGAIPLAQAAVQLADGSEFFELKAETRLALAEALGPGEEAARVAAEAADIYERKGNLVMRERAARTLTSLRVAR
jgi:class 3 adenylate cyclase/tetratricopeptide (TPR) repeat protein